MSAHTVEQVTSKRQALDYARIIHIYRNFCVERVLHLTARLGDVQDVCKVHATSVNEGAEMDSIGDMPCPFGAISQRKQHVKLNHCNGQNLGMSVRT